MHRMPSRYVLVSGKEDRTSQIMTHITEEAGTGIEHRIPEDLQPEGGGRDGMQTSADLPLALPHWQLFEVGRGIVLALVLRHVWDEVPPTCTSGCPV